MFGKKKTEEPEVIVQEPVKEELPQVSSAPTYTPSRKTIIAEGVTMVGDFVTGDPIEINGTLKGNVVSETSMYVSKGGKLKGDARVSEITIDGSVDGALVVEGLSTISDTGSMKGSLQTARFSSQPGSIFEGTFSMAVAKKAKKPAKAEEAAEAPAETAEAPAEE